jgi:hypothetical protein
LAENSNFSRLVCWKTDSALPWKVQNLKSKVVDYGGMSILPHEQSARIAPMLQVQHAIWD